MGASEEAYGGTGIPQSMREGGDAVRVQKDGRGYLWVGVMSWGHKPYGADPIVWSCETCGLLTADITLHNLHHRAYYRLMGKILARLGLTKDGETDAGT